MIGLASSQKAAYVAGLYAEIKGSPQLQKGPLYVITYTVYQAEQLHADLMSFVPREDLFFPAQEVFVYEKLPAILIFFGIGF